MADGKVGNGVYALPSHYVGQAIITNGPLLEEKGINYDQQVKTWDDLAALGKELGDPGRKFWGLSDPTLGTTQRHLQAWIRQAGQELFTPDGSLGFTAETLRHPGWTSGTSCARTGVIPPADVEVQADAGGMATNMLVTNQAAIVPASSNGLTQIQRLTKTPLSMFSIPEVAGASKDWWFFPPILLSVAANTKSPQLSASLVDFFVNSVPAGKITRVDQGAPSSSAVRDALVPELDAPEAAFVKQISREMTYPARPLPVLPQASAAVVTAQMEASQQVAYGQQSVSQAVDAFMAAAQQGDREMTAASSCQTVPGPRQRRRRALLQDDTWLVRSISSTPAVAGWLILQARRHVADPVRVRCHRSGHVRPDGAAFRAPATRGHRRAAHLYRLAERGHSALSLSPPAAPAGDAQQRARLERLRSERAGPPR